MKKIVFINLFLPVLLSVFSSLVLFFGSDLKAQENIQVEERPPLSVPAITTQMASGVDRDVASLSAVSGEDKEETEKMIQKVRTRSYPGGNDESDLKVQSLLQKPTRKMAPNAEETSDSAASQD